MGSPEAPGSLVRSSTATRVAVAGSAARKASVGNGRYRRIWITPTRPPDSLIRSTTGVTASMPEPMMTTTRSASGAPWYSTSR